VPEPDAFETWVRSGLAHHGLEADDVDIAVMRAAEEVYGPARKALMESDMSAWAREHALDPSRSPFEDERP
jgi:hypothetical protein